MIFTDLGFILGIVVGAATAFTWPQCVGRHKWMPWVGSNTTDTTEHFIYGETTPYAVGKRQRTFQDRVCSRCGIQQRRELTL